MKAQRTPSWKEATLREVVSLQRGHDLIETQRRQGNVPVMSAAGRYGVHDTAVVTGPGVVVGRSGASIGQVHYCDVDFWAHNTALYVTSFHGNDPRFIYYFLQSLHLNRYNSGGAQPSLNRNFIYPLEVALPEPEEQRAMAAALSDVDALIGALDNLIAKKRAIKLAAMHQLLTGKTRLPGFGGDWSSAKLGELGQFSKGRGIKRDDVSDDGVRCIRYGEIYTRYDNYVTVLDSRILPKVALTALPIKNGDLLFAGSGETAEEIGKCVAYVGEEEAYAGGDIVVLSPSEGNPVYLGHLMNHFDVAQQKSRFGQGDAVVHISARNLARVNVCLPRPEEQDAIASVLLDLDAEITALEQRRNKTKAIKQGMMQALLTGRVRLMKPERAGEETT